MPNQSCALRVLHATVCHSFFTALFPFRSLHHTEHQGSFLAHVDTHTHEPMQKTHARTHAHINAVYLITLLLICRALIENPLSLSSTCIPSLIISQGAFGGRREGDGDGRRGLQVSCDSPVVHPQI